MATQAQQNQRKKHNLALLANGGDPDETIITIRSKAFGTKTFYGIRSIIKEVSVPLDQWILHRRDEHRRVDLTGIDGALTFSNMMKFVYTRDYLLTTTDPNFSNVPKSRVLHKHIWANIIGRRYDCQPYAQAAKAAFIAMKPTLELHNSVVIENNAAKNHQVILAWFECGLVIVDKGDRLDPCFEAWFVRWLRIAIPYVRDDLPWFWNALATGKLKPLADKANLKPAPHGTLSVNGMRTAKHRVAMPGSWDGGRGCEG